MKKTTGKARGNEREEEREQETDHQPRVVGDKRAAQHGPSRTLSPHFRCACHPPLRRCEMQKALCEHI